MVELVDLAPGQKKSASSENAEWRQVAIYRSKSTGQLLDGYAIYYWCECSILSNVMIIKGASTGIMSMLETTILAERENMALVSSERASTGY
jgi:hypothetical protein